MGRLASAEELRAADISVAPDGSGLPPGSATAAQGRTDYETKCAACHEARVAGAKGNRFVLLEAGHVAQNINLVANALGLGAVNLGGYYDREIDDFLGLDGVTHSTIYMAAIGKKNG